MVVGVLEMDVVHTPSSCEVRLGGGDDVYGCIKLRRWKCVVTVTAHGRCERDRCWVGIDLKYRVRETIFGWIVEF